MRAGPALLVVAALVLAGLPTSQATNKHKEKHHPSKHHHTTSRRSLDDTIAQVPENINLMTKFQPGLEYCFQYNSQIASGYAPWVSTQRAMTRMESKVCIAVQQQDQKNCVLRMDKIRIGQRNELPNREEDQPWNAAQILPIRAFQQMDRHTVNEMRQKLRLPCEFNYVEGSVDSVQFHKDDQTWSKNIKKAVLNLIQLNLKASNTQQQDFNQDNNYDTDDMDQPLKRQQRQLRQQSGGDRLIKAFSTLETTLEGVCETDYTILSGNQNAEINITKSINFDRCEKLSDVGYGFQVDPIPSVEWPQQQDLTSRSSNNIYGQQEEREETKTGRVVPQEKLDRSTVIRYVLGNNENNYNSRRNIDMDTEDTEQDTVQQEGNGYAVKRVELLSEYTFKSSEAESNQAMQTIAVAELVLLGTKQVKEQHNKIARDDSRKPEALVYNADVESQEKQYYMFGDEKFSGKNTPFPSQYKDSKAVVEQAERHLEILCRAFGTENKQNGHIESSSTVEHFEKLVDILRICSVEELKQVDQKTNNVGVDYNRQHNKNVEEDIDQGSVAKDLFADALAVAATRNTIAMLEEKIRSQSTNDMSEIKAAQLLKILGRGSGLIAPSEGQVDAILRLCKSSPVQQSKLVLKQSCWLTFGTMVGELNLQTVKAKRQQHTVSPMLADEQASDHKLELYKEVLIEQLNMADDIYEKVLALRCIGNAGLLKTLPSLEALIYSKAESPIVRINAIDALRRLRHQMPAKTIQSILLPVYLNVNGQPEVRMNAFSMILQTRPSNEIIDQITYCMANEKSEDVQGFVYSAMKAAAKSPIAEQRKLADHLKNALKVAKIDEEQLDAKHMLETSRRWSAPLYSQDQQEGAFLNLVSMFSPEDSTVPSHISFGMDTYFNGHYNRNAMKMSLCQKDIDKIVQHIFNPDFDSDSEDDNQSKKSGQQKKPGFFHKAADQLRSIFSKLKIKDRHHHDQERYQPENQSPYFVVSFRMNDVDVLMIPVNMDSDEGSMSRMKNLLTSTLHNLFSRTDMQRFQLNSAMVLNSRQASIPTSVGLSLRMSQSMYVIGQLKADFGSGAGRSQTKIKFHPNANWVQTQKMEVRAMTYASGVRSSRSVAVNLPIDMETTSSGSSQKKAEIKVKIPQEITRLVTAQSLPTTYLGHTNEKSGNQTEVYFHRVKTVHDEQLQGQIREVNMIVGNKGFFAVPIKVHGHFQKPRKMFNLKELLKSLMTGQNHISVDLDPSQKVPKEIRLTLSADIFQATANSPATSIKPRIQDFYNSRNTNQDNNRLRQGQVQQDDQRLDDEDYESSEEDDQQFRRQPSSTYQQQGQKTSTYLDKFADAKKQNYKHSVKATIEVRGGQQQNTKLETQLETVCDSRLRACEATFNAKCKPASGQKDWTVDAQVQTLYPEHVSDIEELFETSNNNHQKFFCHMEAIWGTNQQKENIKVQIEGQASEEVLRSIQQQQQQQYNDQDNQQSYYGRRQQKQKRHTGNKVPFINQYTMVAEYQLQPTTQQFFQTQLECLKARNFWNTKSELTAGQVQQQQSGRQGAQQGQAMCFFNIDPVTGMYANVTIETPAQKIRFRPLELWTKIRPMPLVRQFRSSSSAHSPSQLLNNILEQSRQNRAQCKVGAKTIDTFDGMAYKAPISKCYTVLAKDCAREGNSKFVVMMRSLERGSEEKKVKIMTQEKTITIEPQGNQMRVKINDKTYVIGSQNEQQQDEQSLRQHGLEFDTDSQNRQNVVVDLENVAVKFNGKTVKIQLPEQYKDRQCGLCGSFNDNSEDDLRDNQDQLSDDVKSFHRSYTLQNEDGECEQRDHEDFYERDQGEDVFSKNTRGNQQQQQDQQKKPIDRTVVTEYNHKVCFSLKPVKQCPEGWTAGEEDEEGLQLLKRSKVQFSCLDRQSIEAKRLRSEVRRNNVADISEYNPSFIDTVVIPETCVQYY